MDFRGERPGVQQGAVEVAPRELDDSERVLLSIAERAGAAELQPGARGVLRMRPTGQLDGRAAYRAIKAAKDRGWESHPRSSGSSPTGARGSAEELIEVRGIGPAFCETHGGPLLATLNEIGILQAPRPDFPANSGLSVSVQSLVSLR